MIRRCRCLRMRRTLLIAWSRSALAPCSFVQNRSIGPRIFLRGQFRIIQRDGAPHGFPPLGEGFCNGESSK